jgi:hypothetical protein
MHQEAHSALWLWKSAFLHLALKQSACRRHRRSHIRAVHRACQSPPPEPWPCNTSRYRSICIQQHVAHRATSPSRRLIAIWKPEDVQRLTVHRRACLLTHAPSRAALGDAITIAMRGILEEPGNSSIRISSPTPPVRACRNRGSARLERGSRTCLSKRVKHHAVAQSVSLIFLKRSMSIKSPWRAVVPSPPAIGRRPLAKRFVGARRPFR